MPLSLKERAKYKSLYLQTAREYIKELKENLKKLQTGKESTVVIDSLHRAAHSLKGQSLMMDYQAMGSLSRLLEFTFAAKRDGILTLTMEAMKKINEAITEMEKCLEKIDKNNKESDLSHIEKEIKAMVGDLG